MRKGSKNYICMYIPAVEGIQIDRVFYGFKAFYATGGIKHPLI